MLTHLSIRDVVLIDRLDLQFHGGLGVLTGETGAGKSILLDSVGLALGQRAEARLVRHGCEQASVTAAFDMPGDGTLSGLLAEHGIEDEGTLVLRRILNADGRSRAFVNDQPVSIGLLRDIGARLVEIQGQFDQQGLMDPATHRGLLDGYAGITPLLTDCRKAFQALRDAQAALTTAREEAAASKANEEYLRFASAELATLDPREGEEAALSEERSRLQNADRITQAVEAARHLLEEGGVEQALGQAGRSVQQAAGMAGDILTPALEALDRATIEVQEVLNELNRAMGMIDAGDGRLEAVEERLFALRDLARKHGVPPENLHLVKAEIDEKLALIEAGESDIAELVKAVEAARKRYRAAADALSAERRQAAERLDDGVNRELGPLRLEKAHFRTEVGALEEDQWGPDGWDRVRFLVATNPGAPPGPLGKIASGGELSRFLLALKVTLAETGGAPTMVFDEVDSGIGGATAAAVGERLNRLARDRQILVVTHSPQVAALGARHWQVAKSPRGDQMVTAVNPLDADHRLEELARMLSGAEITDEARAAAQRLLAGA